MNGADAALLIGLLVIVALGLFVGVVLAARNPAFWVGFGKAVLVAAMPKLVEFVTRRMPPEQEQAWRDCQRRGGKWNHLKRRCE